MKSPVAPQLTLVAAVEATGSVTRSGVAGQEGVTALVRSSAASGRKLALIPLLYLHPVANSPDPETAAGREQ